MRYIFILILNGLLLFPFIAEAQITPQQKRKILYEVSNVLENYEILMYCDNEGADEDFKNLFVSDSILIFNDLLGFSSREHITLREYIAMMRDNVKNPTIHLKNIKNKGILDLGKIYQVSLSFDKSLSYSDKYGVLFSNSDYFGKDYRITMHIDIDKENLIAKISDIEGQIDSDKPLLEQGTYVVLNKTNPLDEEVRCNGNLLDFNSFDQAILPADYKFSYADPDMKLYVRKENSQSHLLTLDYKLKRWTVQPYFEKALTDPYKAEDEYSNMENSSEMSEFGVKMKYTFPRKSKTKWGLNFGLGFSKSKIDLSLKGIKYSYMANGYEADIDGDDYERFYDIKNVSQTIDLNNLVIPFSVELERVFGKRFSISMEAGVKAYLNLSAKNSKYLLEENVYGVYYGYGNPIIFDKPEYWGYNGFGNQTLSLNELQNEKLEVETFTADAFVGLGFSLKLVGPLSINAGIKYQYGIMNPIKNDNVLNMGNLYDENFTGFSKRISQQESLVTYTVNGGENVKSLTNMTRGFKRNTLLLNVGLSFKF